MSDDESLNFEMYVKKNYPKIVHEWYAYNNRENLPSCGDIVEVLVSGYGGDIGVRRFVEWIDGDNIVICDSSQRKYHVPISTWYTRIKVIVSGSKI